ncbi:hypothetical protein LAZ67_5002034 [Cordylochernes scorpioides]|uniref:Transposase n=1 Tax=Cordylochernes scorpioides TaxID=51811 RepID=A0ABY6KJ46_9ARAC|nr:hypothetical protein LAZ67_5002034 [Cordylochernes scorpioides]
MFTVESVADKVGSQEATLDRSNVYRWYKRFSEGREDVNDEERAGRPSTSTTDEKINEVEKMILANRLITVREVAEDLNISIGSCHSIFINDLGMKRVAAKFVPKLLNCDQKQHRMNIANEMLDSVRDDPNLLQRVITGDEAGVVYHEFLPQGRTVNKEYYLQVMRNLREAIRQKRPDLWKNKNWLLHHDNAPAHTSLLVRDFLAKNNTLMMPQPPYSPDLAPCDFFLFPKLKRPMKGRRYATLDEIKTASKEELKKIKQKNHFLKCFEDWKTRWHNMACVLYVLIYERFGVTVRYVTGVLRHPDGNGSTRLTHAKVKGVDIARHLKSYGIRTYYKNSPNLLTSLRHPYTKPLVPMDPLRSDGAVYSVSYSKLAEFLLKMILGKNAQNVQKITDLIKENPRTTLLELEQDTGISKTTIGRIVTKDLKLKKTPAKFIPRFLTNEQKLCRLATCENMLEMTRTDPEWKDKIITGDETWVYDYDPETKRQYAEWRGQDIAPNDFFLFPKLKAVLKGRHFDTRDDIIEKSLLALKSIPKELYKNCFDNLGKRWRWPSPGAIFAHGKGAPNDAHTERRPKSFKTRVPRPDNQGKTASLQLHWTSVSGTPTEDNTQRRLNTHSPLE